MPREVRNQLTALRVKNEKKPGRYADGMGLYLVVSEHGSRWWQWRGTVHGKRRELGIGSALLVSLSDARAIASEWREIARSGGDPAAVRDKKKRSKMTFEQAARHVWQDQIDGHVRNSKHAAQWIRTLETAAFPKIGSRDIFDISQADILSVLRPIWLETPETARRVRQRLKAVFEWARVSGYCEGINPVEGVERALPRQKDRQKHFKALPFLELPSVFGQIADAEGMGAQALMFAILTATRSGEVRKARWMEFDLKSHVWTIPPDRMKANLEHRVPLSDPAIAHLKALQRFQDEELVFPSARLGRPLSDMTLAAVLKRLNIPAVPHGFRSTFRDWVSETTETPHAVAEMALAHSIPNRVEAAYRRGDLFEKRRVLMSKWADFATSAV
ncbi:integrase arm-type DNA-binding domain-containing protein [Tateyamaria sp. Alg231-49]|uniref:tyrosine-type recombinase/integrase n=1 Tax=Tateyamaria sp. Alg231-49 TaxID=1922219 RepID=UPI001F225579|nr:integrase arm-type DNA-binding domain-containing protein [Tateyamaria sp. Alg231-49]